MTKNQPLRRFFLLHKTPFAHSYNPTHSVHSKHCYYRISESVHFFAHCCINGGAFGPFFDLLRRRNGVVEAVATRHLQSGAVGIMRIVAESESESATETKNREPRGIMKLRRVSPEMRDFLGGLSEIPRTRALKEIWAYIKQHDLQDPTDKKVIICDEKLKTIFGGRDRVGFLKDDFLALL